MSKYIIRLDDAAEKMNITKWNKMEKLLDKYNIKPLVGVIPNCKDPMMDVYQKDLNFWKKVNKWEKKGWTIALHGYEHLYCTNDGGINPVNLRSEFAGVSLEDQKLKIKKGVRIFEEHGINPKVFFAPSHTFDENTIEALKSETSIRIISDTISNKPYTKYGITFIPQQSGKVRKLPFNTVTFCYHPNEMKKNDFEYLEIFLKKNKESFISFPLVTTNKKVSFYDTILKKIYFLRKERK